MTPKLGGSLERLQRCEDTSQVGLSLATLSEILSALFALTQGDVMSSSTFFKSLRPLHQREMPLCSQWAQQSVGSRYTITAASLCLMILSGLSAGCSADGDFATDSADASGRSGYYGEAAGESADNASNDPDSLSAPEMENDQGYAAGEAPPDEGVAAGEVDAAPAESCTNSAYQETEAGADEGEPVTVCLDDLVPLGGQNNDDPDRLESDAANPSCNLEDELSGIISEASGEQVTCVDRDADCYYECPGWELPEHLQDIDDRRAFVNRRGDAAPDVDHAQTCRDQVTAGDETLCCQLNTVDMALDGDVSPLICRTPLSTNDEKW